MSAGEQTAFVVYAFIMASAVGAISQVIGDLQRAAGATERLLELLHAESAILPPQDPVSFPTSFQGAIQLEKVSFHYPSRPDTAALQALSLTIKAGSSLALVGPSGAGKSTLFDLLLRFFTSHNPDAFWSTVLISVLWIH
ncbi:MAG: ATP-binding cassette domain-containing protein [Desulfuromonadales bacterium]|nr:ATP-binding cassette domain-containing protein [Desulfuromonadales bacterium]